MKVLALFANPRGTSSLRLGEEDRVLQECVRRSKNRDNIALVVRHAVTIDDARRALLDDDYDLVHFSGHGTGTGLAFEDLAGRLYVPPREAIAELLSEFSPPLSCVILNACYSTSQGSLTSLGIPFTVAMEGPISDGAAIVFAGAFYDSIAAAKDIEFSFRQGVIALKLAGHRDSTVPKLIKQGEAISSQTEPIVASHSARAADSQPAAPLILGVAIDVSGSMESSINNRVGDKQSRLMAFRDSLDRGTLRVGEYLNSIEAPETSIQLFAYAFGLRTGDVCDLFSLIKATDGLIAPGEIDELKERYSSEISARYSGGGYGGLESLARQYLGSRTVDSFKQSARAQAETEVRNRIFAEIQRRLSQKLSLIGDTTVNLREFLDMWKASDQAIADAEGLIFGNTPMCEALKKIKKRFDRELSASRDEKPASILLVVSDGESTDGDPVALATEIRGMGVTIIGGYITDRDVLEPRVLLESKRPNWSKGAADMFEMSSPIPDDSELTRHLLRQGWRAPKGSRAFFQANHSELLDDIVGLALSPLEAGQSLLPKGL